MCIEHGELAQLAEWKPEYPGQPEPQCPSCHTTDGHPHTDYCRHADTRHLVSEHLGGTKPADTEALCGLRSLDNLDLVCTYPPHPVSQMHSWQDGGDPRGWRNAIDPNKP
jgi:hypothetical protein